MIHFNVLGSLQVRHGDLQLEPSATPRRLLGLLLAQAGQALTVGLIADQLWQSRPPRTARKAVQVYVHQLRRLLADSHQIRHDEGTYRLTLASSELDSEVLGAWTALARQQQARGDLTAAAQSWGKALSLWRGPAAYADVDNVALVSAERDRLDEARAAIQENLLAVELDLGLDRSVIVNLGAITAERPYHERVHGLAMIALYRGGRQAEALATYRRLHDRLVADLGVEPTPHLQRLHYQILNHDPALWERPIGVAMPV